MAEKKESRVVSPSKADTGDELGISCVYVLFVQLTTSAKESC